VLAIRALCLEDAENAERVLAPLSRPQARR
jgi:hypothetical protein